MKISWSFKALAGAVLCPWHLPVVAFVTQYPLGVRTVSEVRPSSSSSRLQMGYLDNLSRRHPGGHGGDDNSNNNNNNNDDDDDRPPPPPHDPQADLRDYLQHGNHRHDPLTSPHASQSPSVGNYDQRRGVGITPDQQVMNTKHVDGAPGPENPWQQQQQQYGSAQAPRTSGGEYNMQANAAAPSQAFPGEHPPPQQPPYNSATPTGTLQNDAAPPKGASPPPSDVYSYYDPQTPATASTRRIWESPLARPIRVPLNTVTQGDFRQRAPPGTTLEIRSPAQNTAANLPESHRAVGRMQVVVMNPNHKNAVPHSSNSNNNHPTRMDASLEVWNPGWGPAAPLQVSVSSASSDNAHPRPLNLLVETPPPPPNNSMDNNLPTATVTIRNTGEERLPQQQQQQQQSSGSSPTSLEAYVVVDNGEHPSGTTLPSPQLRTEPILLDGGRVQEFEVARMGRDPSPVQVFLDPQGQPLNARIEVVDIVGPSSPSSPREPQQPRRVQQVIDLYSEEGWNAPLFLTLETPPVPGVLTVVRVINMEAPEFALAISAEPVLMTNEVNDRQNSVPGTSESRTRTLNQPPPREPQPMVNPGGGGMMPMTEFDGMGDPYFDDLPPVDPDLDEMGGYGYAFGGFGPYRNDYQVRGDDFARMDNGFRRTYVGNGYRVSGSFYDINKGRPGSGFKVIPGAGSRFNGRGELVDNGNMGSGGIRYAASSVPQFGRRMNNQGYYY